MKKKEKEFEPTFNPRDYKLSLDTLNHDIAEEKLEQLLQFAINIQKYAEAPLEAISFQDWHARKEDMWGAAILCKAHLFPFFFKEWIEQGSLSLNKTLAALDPQEIIRSAKKHKFRTGEELTTEEKIDRYWFNHECTKWLLEILRAITKGPYEAHYSPELSEKIKDECAKPYLVFMENLGLDGTIIAREVTDALTKRRVRKNDNFFLQVFRTDINRQLRLPLNGNGSTASLPEPATNQTEVVSM